MSDKKARDIMSDDCTCIGENDTVLDAAKRLAELNVGSMPICGEDDRLKGMLTDRDIVVKVLAKGMDPSSTRAGELATQGEVITIGADDSVDEALRTMTDHKVRRLPVINKSKRMVGMLALGDVSDLAPSDLLSEYVKRVSAHH